MTYLTALLPVATGVATYTALTHAADTARASTGGEPRTRGQVMADTLATRLLNQPDHHTGHQQPHVPVTINLVVSDQTLLAPGPDDRATGPTDSADSADSADDSAHLDGYGPIPGQLARELASNPEASVQLRRLYATPTHPTLVAMDARTRRFPPALATFIRLRDHTCRTPWCQAPIRHIDHITAHTDAGPTTATNAQGLCEACNYAKTAPGWTATSHPTAGQAHRTHTTTPTGHTYDATAPPTPTPTNLTPPDLRPTPLEHTLELALHHAA